MNIRASVKYQLKDSLKPIIIFSAIVLGALLLIATLITIVVNTFPQHFSNMSGTLNGADSATAIFVFILGLSSFKEYFYMHMQHGASRRTQFFGRSIAAAIIACALAVISKVVIWVMQGYAALAGTFYAASAFSSSYNMAAGAGTELTHIVFLFASFLFLISLGYFITTLFYRLNAGGKVAVGVGVPVTLFILYPTADALLFNGAITTFLMRAYQALFGAPWMAILSYVLLAAVLSLLGWLLVRRAAVKG